jgi:peroxiredoxin Q/BCP
MSVPRPATRHPISSSPTRTARSTGWPIGARLTVVYFYPADDTPGCTTEACQFGDNLADLDAEGAAVWGISPDGAASHAAFRSKFGLRFSLLSDEDHAVAERYGAWVLKRNYGREYMGIQRSTFLVDPDGRVAVAWPQVKADGHAAEVLAALSDLRGGTGA